jgi:hypothetical protein
VTLLLSCLRDDSSYSLDPSASPSRREALDINSDGTTHQLTSYLTPRSSPPYFESHGSILGYSAQRLVQRLGTPRVERAAMPPERVVSKMH